MLTANGPSRNSRVTAIAMHVAETADSAAHRKLVLRNMTVRLYHFSRSTIHDEVKNQHDQTEPNQSISSVLAAFGTIRALVFRQAERGQSKLRLRSRP